MKKMAMIGFPLFFVPVPWSIQGRAEAAVD